MRKIFLLSVVIVLAARAETSEICNPIQTYFSNAKPNGTGTVYKWIVPAYDISLWTKTKPWTFEKLFALQVCCRWDASKTEMVDSTIEVMERNPNLPKEKACQYKELLNSFYPDLKAEDLITVIVSYPKYIRFYHNNRLLKEIHDMKFAAHFSGIWLDEKTKYESARKAMLGL